MKTLAQLIGTDISTIDTIPALPPKHVIMADSGDGDDVTDAEQQSIDLIGEQTPKMRWAGEAEYVGRIGLDAHVLFIMNGTKIYTFELDGEDMFMLALFGTAEAPVERAISSISACKGAPRVLEVIKNIDTPEANEMRHAAEKALASPLKALEVRDTDVPDYDGMMEEWDRAQPAAITSMWLDDDTVLARARGIQ